MIITIPMELTTGSTRARNPMIVSKIAQTIDLVDTFCGTAAGTVLMPAPFV
jgi:hypothetical protein